MPFEDNFFDFIQIISTIENVIDPASTLKEAFRVLKDNGYLYLVLHKRSFDPLFIFELYFFIKMFSTKITKTNKNYSSDQYSLPISRVRKEIFKTARKLDLKFIERGDLVSYINIAFYRKFKLPMSFLMKIAKITNELPFSIFKNLEYRVYQK